MISNRGIPPHPPSAVGDYALRLERRRAEALIPSDVL
jgi:hypothetical protein